VKTQGTTEEMLGDIIDYHLDKWNTGGRQLLCSYFYFTWIFVDIVIQTVLRLGVLMKLMSCCFLLSFTVKIKLFREMRQTDSEMTPYVLW